MARPISDEELQLKKRARRRLVGAIVLVTAVAVILPMVLDSEPKPVSNNVDIQIPSPDTGEFNPKRPAPASPAVSKAAPAPEPASRIETEPAKDLTTPQPAKRDVAQGKAAAPEPAKEASPEEAKPAAKDKAAAGGAYVVQVAALSDVVKAKQLEKQMAGAGLRTFTEVVSTQTGEVTRVRAGPYATREAADKALSQLKKVGLEGRIIAK